ncbi:MAG TPA: ABC transporter substrate-binding protein, partial [Woeseiaceae bacterium]|nr:ABC transporter substrate-binding protein [Woeseiaceae bacterium]
MSDRQSRLRRLRPAAALGLLALLLLGSCGGPAEAPPSVLNRAVGPEPESLDPHHSRTAQAHTVQRDLFEGLVSYSPSGELVPGVASDWQLSDDGLRYTFTLRPEARWSNGDAVTADDFVYSLRRIMTPATGATYANILYPILNAEAVNKGELPPAELGVKAVDARTLEITLAQPTPYFLELMTHQTALPV